MPVTEAKLLEDMKRNKPVVAGTRLADQHAGEPISRLSSAEIETMIVNAFNAINGSANPNRVGLGKDIADRLNGVASREYVLVVLERKGLRARRKVEK